MFPSALLQVRARLAVESPAMGTISAARFGSGHEVFLQLLVEQLPPRLRSLQLSRGAPSGACFAGPGSEGWAEVSPLAFHKCSLRVDTLLLSIWTLG